MKKPSRWLNLIAVPLTLVLGVWAAATIHLQTELLPLFPAKYASVRGVRQSLSVLSSAQELTVILTKPAATTDIADRLESTLTSLPEVQAISVVGQPRMEPIVKMAAWVVANLPPDKFTEFQSLFTEKEMEQRLQDTRDQLAGAVDPGQVLLLRMDPLQMLPWLQAQPHQSLPLPDFSGSEAPSVIVMQLRARGPLRTFEQCQNFVGQVRRTIDVTVGPASPDVRQAIVITGQPAYVAENSAQMRSDMTVMVLLATGLTSLVLWLCYRSRSALVWMTVVLALALLAGTIVARVLFGELNVISIGFSSILIGLGSDYCILVYHFYALRDEDIPGRDLAGDWRRTRRGIWLSAAATTLAFGTLYFSSFPGLQQMVVLIGAGLLATAFFATTLLSDILQRARPVMPGWLMTTSDTLARWQERQRRRIIFGVLASLTLVACLWPVLRGYKFYDPDFSRLRPAHSEADRGVQLLMKSMQSHKTLDVIVSAPSWAELRAKADRVTKDATLLPQADYYAVNRAQWRPGKQSALKAALDKAGFEENWGAATLLLLDSMDAWVRGTEDFQSARLFLSNVVELPGGEKAALLRLPLEGAGLRELWEQVKQREPTSLPASWQLMIEDLQRGVLQDSRTLSLWMLLAIVLVCWWANRSWAQAAINGLALAVTTVLFLALLWATRQSMTLHSLLAVPVMVAVAIEYSLYILLSLQGNAGDLKRTFRQLAVPVLLMGLTSIIGFGAPVATHQPALQNFGMMMAMGTFAAMATGIVVVPAFYSTAGRRPHYSQTLYRAFWFELAERCVRNVRPRCDTISRGGPGLVVRGHAPEPGEGGARQPVIAEQAAREWKARTAHVFKLREDAGGLFSDRHASQAGGTGPGA